MKSKIYKEEKTKNYIILFENKRIVLRQTFIDKILEANKNYFKGDSFYISDINKNKYFIKKDKEKYYIYKDKDFLVLITYGQIKSPKLIKN